MTWEWSKFNREALAGYVTRESVKWLTLPENRLDLAKYLDGRRILIEAIYDAVSKKGIQYAPEAYDPSDAIQPIRTPVEIFESPHEGTCLDLAVLFCGLCMGNDLLPTLIVIEKHALAGVSLKYGLSDWNSLEREERDWFQTGPLTDVALLRKLIDRGDCVAVECTGFAESESLPESVPEGKGRDGNGLLPFDKAVIAGRDQLDRQDQPLRFALDIAVAQYDWKIPLMIGPGLDPKAYSIYRVYRKRFKEALQKELPEPAIDFDLTFKLDGDDGIPVGSLINKTIDARRLILRGYAGGGKSALLRKCANLLLDKGIIPIIINLKKWTVEHSKALSEVFEQQRDVDQKFDILLDVSITDLNRNMLNFFPSQFEKFVMVDGLNEVYGKETTREILDLLDDYVKEKAPYLYVVVTDRMVQREAGPSKWRMAELNLLTSEEVRKQIRDHFGDTAFEPLPDADKELLRVPYFLDYALESGSPQLGSAAKAIEAFFRESFFMTQEKFGEAALNQLAKAAFNAYKTYKSTSFNAEIFRADAGEDTWNKLLESGVLKLSGGDVRFDHQLKHDYLASRYLALHNELWNSDSFDAVTFESKTFEPLLMTLEQLSDTTQGDKFIKNLYDWNWVATVTSLAKSDPKLFSDEMSTFVLAAIAEKLFDPIRPTRERARMQLSEFSPEVCGPFAKAENITAIFDIVGAFNSDVPWFLEWKHLFTRYNDPPLREAEIRRIADRDPILGWTAANVIRRFKLSDADLRQLRAIYDAFDALPNDSTQHAEVAQWRVVHALGMSDTKENVDLLFRALDGQGYHWAKFGAARSLIEIAAITENDDLRMQIIGDLKDRIASVSRKVLEEIGNAIFYRAAPDSWGDLITPLLEKARDTRRDEVDRERINNVLDDFRIFVKEERAK
jgi:hypothetical protein